MTAGVYAIYLVGTPYVYIGESSNVEQRWANHRDSWVWPNNARYVLLFESDRAKLRKRLETEEHSGHSADGFLLLSAPGTGNSGLKQAQRSRSSWAALSEQERQERVKKSWATRHKRSRKAVGQLVRWRKSRQEMAS